MWTQRTRVPEGKRHSQGCQAGPAPAVLWLGVPGGQDGAPLQTLTGIARKGFLSSTLSQGTVIVSDDVTRGQRGQMKELALVLTKTYLVILKTWSNLSAVVCETRCRWALTSHGCGMPRLQRYCCSCYCRCCYLVIDSCLKISLIENTHWRAGKIKKETNFFPQFMLILIILIEIIIIWSFII